MVVPVEGVKQGRDLVRERHAIRYQQLMQAPASRNSCVPGPPGGITTERQWLGRAPGKAAKTQGSRL